MQQWQQARETQRHLSKNGNDRHAGISDGSWLAHLHTDHPCAGIGQQEASLPGASPCPGRIYSKVAVRGGH